MEGKKVEVLELTLTFPERWFDKYDQTILNFNKVMMISRPTILEDGKVTIKAKPICEDNTAVYICNHATELANGYKEKSTGTSEGT